MMSANSWARFRVHITQVNLSNIKGVDTLFVQEIDNMEHITSHTHLKHINTSTFTFMAKAQGQTLV